MNLKVKKDCIIDGKSVKAGEHVDIAKKEARKLIAMGLAEGLEVKELKVDVSIDIDPKELEKIKEEIENKDKEINELKEQIELCKKEALAEVSDKDKEIEKLKKELEALKTKKR